jgi:hypothetical protein
MKLNKAFDMPLSISHCRWHLWVREKRIGRWIWYLQRWRHLVGLRGKHILPTKLTPDSWMVSGSHGFVKSLLLTSWKLELKKSWWCGGVKTFPRKNLARQINLDASWIGQSVGWATRVWFFPSNVKHCRLFEQMFRGNEQFDTCICVYNNALRYLKQARRLLSKRYQCKRFDLVRASGCGEIFQWNRSP